MGARPLKRFIQDNIINKLSDEILFGKLKSGGVVEVDLKDKLVIKCTSRS
jgi:ATP-dependent Clp protease ATP-binding subunit ClpA